MSRGANSPNTTTPKDANMMATRKKESRMKPVTGATCRAGPKTPILSAAKDWICR